MMHLMRHLHSPLARHTLKFRREMFHNMPYVSYECSEDYSYEYEYEYATCCSLMRCDIKPI